MSIRTRTSGLTFEVAPPPPTPFVYVGPGDVVASATAYCGLRAYTNAAIGTNCVRLEEDNTSTQQDFVTLATGLVDVASAIAFRDAHGATNLIVRKLYDQTGNGHDIDYPGGTAVLFVPTGLLGSKPVVDMNGGTQQDLGADVAQPFTIMAVHYHAATGAARTLVLDNGINHSMGFENGGVSGQDFAYDGSVYPFAAADSVWHTLHAHWEGASTVFYVDGSGTGASTGAGALRTPLGWNDSNLRLVEAGIWPIGFTAGQAASMNSNQKTFWGF